MKKLKRFVWVSLLLWVAACMPSVPSTAAPTTSPTQAIVSQPTEAATETDANIPAVGLTVESLKNSSYFSPLCQKTVQLAEGQSVSGECSVTLLPEIAIGDLNGDQVEDAAVLLAENGGGTGVFVSLVVIASNGEKFEQVGSYTIDDRPIIHSLIIQDGNVFLEATIHSINDIMAEPTLSVKEKFGLNNQILTLTSFSSMIQGGAERLISLDLPVEGSEISNPIQIKGSMPIAPFENNLSLAIYDLSGLLLYQSGFMVNAENPGEPATFDSNVSVENLPTNTWVWLELSERSMADGSLISMNSVLVKVR